MLRAKPIPPPAPLVLIDEATHDPRRAVARFVGPAAYTASPPGPDGATPPAQLRPELRPLAQVEPSPIGPQTRDRLRGLLAKVDERTRQHYAKAVLAFRAADALLVNRREVAKDFQSYGVTSNAAMLELREAIETHQVAEQALRAASQALHTAVLVEAERERTATATEAAQRLGALRAAQQDHAAAVRAAESAGNVAALLRNRPRAALVAALVEEGC